MLDARYELQNLIKARCEASRTMPVSSGASLAVAGFNYGRFKKKEVTDSETKYEIEGYATSEVPDYLRNFPGALTPSRLTGRCRTASIFPSSRAGVLGRE